MPTIVDKDWCSVMRERILRERGGMTEIAIYLHGAGRAAHVEYLDAKAASLGGVRVGKVRPWRRGGPEDERPGGYYCEVRLLPAEEVA